MSAATTPTALRDLGAALRRWAADGVGVVRVLDRHGFGTVEPGQLLVARPGGEHVGQVLRGALDTVAVALASESTREPGATDAHVAEDAAVAAGLACAGGARLLGHPLPAELAEALGVALEAGRPAALASTADGSAQLVLSGADLESTHGGLGDADELVAGAARQLLRRGATTTERLTDGGQDVLLDLWVPVPTVLVIGSGAIGDALLAQAALLGWPGEQVTELADARDSVARFTEADVLVLLDHAPRFDAVLIDGVRGGRGFIGALGSRRTQSARRDRLVAAGLSEDELSRVRGPVGLDLGARTPAETAISIFAEVLARRGDRGGVALAATAGRISS
ncbi:XdhC family protein [Pseudonocardia spinosispora]|uniref:XdhC family protein n=1 Tax=Pseudonocardia spinosispora TaxID=103441 RepID=UPI00042A790F|nr:XdhC family protein [Pseudonocardia spinosispora]